MTTLSRSLAALVTAAALGCSAAAPALAAPSSADRAARWLATQVSDGALDDGFSPVSASIEGLIAFAASDDAALQPQVDALLKTVKAGAQEYVASGGAPAAAKLAIVAGAYDLDPTDVGGVDLVKALRAGVAADGSVGPYASAFSSGVAAAGFARAGVDAPTALTTWLIKQQNADGGFGFAAGEASDADNTALAILGLATDGSADAKAALAKASAWAEKNQRADGSRAGYVPVNSTCVLGSALLAAGGSTGNALSYVKAQQLSSGAISNGTSANVMATSQCAPFLAGESYLSVEWSPAASTPTTKPTAPSATPAKPTATPTGSVPTTAKPTAPATSDAPGRGVPAHTGVEGEAPVGLAALAGLAVAALAAVGGRRK